MGRKLGATPCFGKAAEHPIIVVSGGLYVHWPRLLAGPPASAIDRGRAIKSPGSPPGLFKSNVGNQAAGL
jgi:hypothetical protein